MNFHNYNLFLIDKKLLIFKYISLPPPHAIKFFLKGLNSIQLTAESFICSKCKQPILTSNS